MSAEVTTPILASPPSFHTFLPHASAGAALLDVHGPGRLALLECWGVGATLWSQQRHVCVERQGRECPRDSNLTIVTSQRTGISRRFSPPLLSRSPFSFGLVGEGSRCVFQRVQASNGVAGWIVKGARSCKSTHRARFITCVHARVQSMIVPTHASITVLDISWVAMM